VRHALLWVTDSISRLPTCVTDASTRKRIPLRDPSRAPLERISDDAADGFGERSSSSAQGGGIGVGVGGGGINT
jgi:hypothetical protein